MNTDKVLALAKQAANSFKTYAMEVTEYDFTDDSIQEFSALIQQQMEADGWRQCAVGQGTTQFCGVAEELRKEHGGDITNPKCPICIAINALNKEKNNG